MSSQTADERPEFRLAVFGMPERYRRLLGIVLRHARHGRYRFSIASSQLPGQFELALVDMTASGSGRLAEALGRVLADDAIVRIGRRRETHSRRPDDLLLDNFVARVLPVLERSSDRLTAHRRASALVAAANPGLVVSDFGQLRRPRVLVVDDSPTVRRQLASALEQMEIDCDCMASANEALDRLKIQRYELVLADVVMPELDGYRLTRTIRKNRALRGLPVVLLTSRSSPFDRARGALAGCCSYLVKPVPLRALRATVLRHLRR
ncbi:MAG TPA: response regulator [Burkholderiaceae bacterium]|nr:response regulator [Burkholderiaceae bacterium]